MMLRSGRAALVAVLLLGVGVLGCGSSAKGPTQYAIGGTIAGLTGSGLVLASPGQPDLVVSAGATSFAFANAVTSGTTYAVTVVQQPTNPAQTCGVASGTGTVHAMDVDGVSVTCLSTGPFRVGGTITRLSPSGQLALGTPGQPDLWVPWGPVGSTGYSFATSVATGVPYSVTVVAQPSYGFCSVANGVGVVAGADVSNVDVTCDGQFGAGPLNVPRAFFVAAPVAVGPFDPGHVLVAGGRTAGAGLPATGSAELFDVRTRRWTVASPMTVPRASPCAARLPAGTVLVAGGSGAVADTAEVYDPASDSWLPTTTRMAVGHDQATCVALPSGKVLITGGLNQVGSGSTAVAELYDPVTGAFTTTGSMVSARYRHSATLLEDGRVLVAGGCTGGSPCAATTPTAELYDPVTGTWSATGSLPVGVFGHTATLLYSKVLVVGGCQSEGHCGPWGARTGSAEAGASLFDPSTGTFTPAGAMSTGRVGHAVRVDLPWLGAAPKVRILGGTYDGAGARTTDVYDIPSGTWEVGPLTAVDHGGYLGVVESSLRDHKGAGCDYWMVIGGLGPWSGAFSLTGQVESGWGECTG